MVIQHQTGGLTIDLYGKNNLIAGLTKLINHLRENFTTKLIGDFLKKPKLIH